MANADLTREIRRAVDTGKVEFGTKSTENTLLTSDCLAVVVCSNIPKLTNERLKEYCTLASVPYVKFDGTSKELGQICGKPFLISSLTVKDAGQSKLMSVIKA